MLSTMKHKPPVSALIFDLDGTLLNSAQDLAIAVNHARAAFQLPPLSTARITTYIGDGITKLLERSFQGSEITVEQAHPVMSSFYGEHMLDNTRPYPGVAETLAKLPQPKVVVSNKPQEFVPRLLEKFELLQHFKFIVGGDTLPVKKPHASIVEYVEQKLDIPISEIVVVGDHKPDLEMAYLCGIRSVFCEYGIGNMGGLSPTWKIREFSDLVGLFGT